MKTLHPINLARAERAQKALDAYVGEEGSLHELGDFLSDLMHLCDRDGIDFDLQVENARYHAAAEDGDRPDDIEQDNRRMFAENGNKF